MASNNYYFEEDNEVDFCKTSNLQNWIEDKTHINNKDCNKEQLNIVQLNLRSIYKYWDTLNIYLNTCWKHIHILMLCETAITNDLTCLYEVPGFKAYNYCRTKKTGGGILLYVRDEIIFLQKSLETKYFENVFGIITLPNNISMNILAIYRPPNHSKSLFLNEISSILSNVINPLENMLFFGDVNLDLLNPQHPVIMTYENILSSHHLIKCINDVTREALVAGNVTRTCIDHIFIRFNSRQQQADVFSSCICDFTIADHFATALNITYGSTITKTKQRGESISIISQKRIDKNIRSFNWNVLLAEQNCVDIYNKLKNIFNNLYEKSKITFYPKPKKRPSAIKLWITDDILEQIKIRDSLYRRWKNSPTNKTYEKNYKSTRNTVSKLIIKSKTTYFNETFKNYFSNSKKTWDQINKLLGRKTKTNCDEIISKYMLKKNSGQTEETIVNRFAEQFSNSISSMVHKCNYKASNIAPVDLPHSMYLPRATCEDIRRIVSQLNNSKSPGIDNIRMFDIKKHITILCPVITHLINKILSQAVIPNELKCSIIRPIYKGGKHTEMENYRPISILPAIEKILEKYISVNLIKYLEKFSIIDPNQYGFQKNKSTEMLLQDFSNYVNQELNDKKHILVLFIDNSKAFDTIDPKKLLQILEAIGIRGKLLELFKNYLTSRQIKVKLFQTYSKAKYMSTGVPQGSILGPTLYIIFVSLMNKIFTFVKHYVYADDTALVISHEELYIAIKLMQHDFFSLQKWSHDAGLIINSKKTKLMHIRSPHAKYNITPIIKSHTFECIHNYSQSCKCETIELVQTYVYLGITVDTHMKWDTHVSNICKRLRAIAGRIYKIKYFMPISTLKIIYLSLAESTIRYGITSWGNSCKTNIGYIQSIQNSMTKLLVSKSIYAQRRDIKLLYQSLNILSVRGILWFKIICQNLTSDSIYKERVDHAYGTRFSKNEGMSIPKIINKYGQRTFSYLVPTIFNKIPMDIKIQSNYTTELKNKIKRWLIDQAFLY